MNVHTYLTGLMLLTALAAVGCDQGAPSVSVTPLKIEKNTTDSTVVKKVNVFSSAGDSDLLSAALKGLSASDSAVLVEALETVGFTADNEIYPLRHVAPYLEKAVVHPDEDVRCAAIDAIVSYFENPAAYKLLKPLLMGDRYPDEKDQALQELFGEDWSAGLRSVVIPCLWDKNQDIRETVLDIINSNSEEEYTLNEAQKRYEKMYKPKS